MHEKTFATKTVPVIAFALALFDLLFIYALRAAWAGIGEALGFAPTAALLVAASAVLLVLSLVCLFAWPRKALARAVIGAAAALLAGYSYIWYVDRGNWPFVLREFLIGLAFAGGVGVAGALVFGYGRAGRPARRAPRAVLVAVAALAGLALAFDLRPNGFDEGPAVFAVGRDYQIVFTTSARSTAWVTVGGTDYYDDYAGYDRSETRVHKIVVPMAELDAAKAYTLYSKAMLLRGPYWALQGRVVSTRKSWRPVYEPDGFQYYCVSDSHGMASPSVKAARWFGDALDFLVIAGDTMSFLDRSPDLEMPLRLAHGVTGGERPVVFARGNHETKGLVADRLHRYVGADGERFYYDFRLGSLWGVVLDLGEDHGDDWFEFYGAARFDGYRDAQTRFLDGLLSSPRESFGESGVRYRLLVCHIPVTWKYEDDHEGELLDAWTARLNRMGVDLALYGHRHELMYLSLDLEPGAPQYRKAAFTGAVDGHESDGSRTDASFPGFIGGRRTDAALAPGEHDYFGGKMVGMAVEAVGQDIVVRYTDARGAVARTVGPWTGDDLGDAIRVTTSRARELAE